MGREVSVTKQALDSCDLLDGDPSAFGDKNEVLMRVLVRLEMIEKGGIRTARPCMIATLSLFSMTLGKTLRVEATLWSFPGPPVAGLM